MRDGAILITMLSGLAAIEAALWLAWSPLAWLFGGVLLCAIATSAYLRTRNGD